MSPTRPAGLRRVLDDLGATLLELVHGDLDRVPVLSGVVIHDPIDQPVLSPASLVLGVGVGDPDELAAILSELGREQAAGLVVRSPVAATPAVRAAAESSGVALLGLTRGATWAQLAAMLRALLAEGDFGGLAQDQSESLSGLPAGDLFALANAIAALLDAPITIEDRANRVLAFSGRQGESDAGRVETVLGLQVPERYSRVLTQRGVFRELYRGEGPVFVDPVGTDDGLDAPALPRAAIAIRAGEEVLGSIWVVLHAPLSPERAGALKEAATLAALHLLRVRAGADVGRRLRADLVGAALEGGPGARPALHRLELADREVVVLALGTLDEVADEAGAEQAGLTSDRRRLADAFALHLSAFHVRSATAVVGDAAYGLLPAGRDDPDAEQTAARIAADFLDRVGDRVPAVIGIGPIAREPGELSRARDGADRALRVLREQSRPGRTARLADLYVSALLLDLRDLVAARGDTFSGPLAVLATYDRVHNTALVATLRAWLDAFGDVNAAAGSLFIHPNTFRYRLRRVTEVAGLDLGDPETRFAVLVQLTMLSAPGLSAPGLSAPGLSPPG